MRPQLTREEIEELADLDRALAVQDRECVVTVDRELAIFLSCARNQKSYATPPRPMVRLGIIHRIRRLYLTGKLNERDYNDSLSLVESSGLCVIWSG